MARLFLSLYLFIALSLVGLAAALDRVFDNNTSPSDPWLSAYSQTLSGLTHLSESELLTLTTGEDASAELSHLQDLHWSGDILRQLRQQHYIQLMDPELGQQLMILLPDDKILTLTHKQPQQPSSSFVTYSSLFFLLFGLILCLWTWPLWRDLSSLSKAASSLKQDGSLPALNIHPTSVIHPIAKSFNGLEQQVKQLLLTQKELTGAVAHEFRTPLSRLKFALAVKPQFDTPPWQEMNQDVDELERLVQEMLDYAAMESAQPEMNMAEVPLKALCQSVCDRLNMNKLQGLSVALSGEEAVIMADGHLIERAVQNILVNASRYANQHINIQLTPNRGQIELSIEDDGPGIPEHQREAVFQPFYRPDQGRDRKRGGAGLGLAIVRRIQQWHQGSCHICHTPGSGATFVLCYPLPETQESQR